MRSAAEYGPPVILWGTDWGTREIGSPVRLDTRRIRYRGVTLDTDTFAEQINASIDSILNPELPFGRFQLSTFTSLMVDKYFGTQKPDGTKSVRVVDDTAKNGDISSVTFTVKPDTTTMRGGLSIALREKQGNGYLVHDLRLGTLNPETDRDYHHATVVRRFESGDAAVCPITGDLLPAQLTVTNITELPETRARGDEGQDLRTTGRRFCARIKAWAEEVSQREN